MLAFGPLYSDPGLYRVWDDRWWAPRQASECPCLHHQVRLEWPTDLAVNPMDNSLYVLDNNVVLQISENHQVRIVAGRPMHCQVPGIDHFLLSKVAVHATLESATALAVSHNGVL